MKVKKSPGKVLKVNFHTYVDQLSEEDKTFTTFNSSKYLMENYGLTRIQYFSLIYNGTIDIPECSKEGCNNKIKFKSPLNGFTKYCSHSCQISDQQLDLFNKGKHISQLDPEGFKSFQMKGTETGVEKATEASRIVLHEMALNGNHPFQQIKSRCTADRNQFVNKNKGSDNCYFYIANNFQLYPDHFKIGITTYGENRIQIPINKRYGDGEKSFYKSIHVLAKGDCEFIANIEYEMKMLLYNNLNLTPEWIHISKLHEFFTLYKNYIKSSTTIQK